jgi:acetyl esterase/lipase
MLDGARVVQFVRSQAQAWNIDRARIAVSGTSAGGTLALWVALHDDLADPTSADPIARFSSRVACASPHSGTAGLQSEYFKQQAGVLKQGAALWQLFGASSQTEFDSPAKQHLAREASPLTLATRDDPPLLLTYQGNPADAPFAADATQSMWIHHVCLGLPLKTRYDDLGLACELYCQSQPPPNGAEIAFLKKHLVDSHDANNSRP